MSKRLPKTIKDYIKVYRDIILLQKVLNVIKVFCAEIYFHIYFHRCFFHSLVNSEKNGRKREKSPTE